MRQPVHADQQRVNRSEKAEAKSGSDFSSRYLTDPYTVIIDGKRGGIAKFFVKSVA